MFTHFQVFLEESFVFNKFVILFDLRASNTTEMGLKLEGSVITSKQLFF